MLIAVFEDKGLRVSVTWFAYVEATSGCTKPRARCLAGRGVRESGERELYRRAPPSASGISRGGSAGGAVAEAGQAAIHLLI